MENVFCKTPLSVASRTLVAVAQGTQPADLVIKEATLVNVCTGELQENISIAVSLGRIAYVGKSADHCIDDDTTVIDARGQYLAPGFMDGHIHVESSMLSASQYARAVVPHGTTAIMWDPHEVCNVLGIPGVELMVEDAARTPLKALITMPSCVPAVPGFEDTGSAILAKDIEQSMRLSNVIGLGEMMNFPGILSGEDNAHDEVGATLDAGKVATGHYSVPETDRGLNAYISTGIRCCHESTRAEDALAKMQRGMYAQFREGSAWHDLQQLAAVITDPLRSGLDTRFACLVSDDTHPHTLHSKGHLDHIVRRAIEEGIDAITAIQMVTINTAQCFHLDHEMGSVAPGKCADLVLLSDLHDCKIVKTIIDGVVVAEEGVALFDLPPFEYPEWATHSMHIKQDITLETFKIPAPDAADATVRTRVIEIIPERVGTYERFIDMPVAEGLVDSDVSQDVLKTFVFERHHETGSFSCGFTKGFGITEGAMASTVAHDAHNLLVLGTNDADMVLAAQTLIASGGGSVVVRDGVVLGHVPLPVAGLMNNSPLEEVAAMVAAEEEAWKGIGCTMPSPFMTMALIPLACLPELRLTNRGIVDCRTFEFVSLFPDV